VDWVFALIQPGITLGNSVPDADAIISVPVLGGGRIEIEESLQASACGKPEPGRLLLFRATLRLTQEQYGRSGVLSLPGKVLNLGFKACLMKALGARVDT
jgi:hypothetical protein